MPRKGPQVPREVRNLDLLRANVVKQKMMKTLPMLTCAALLTGCATHDPQSLYRKGHEHFQAGRNSKAAPILSQFLEPSGVSESAHMMLAESYARMGEHQKAIQVFEALCGGYEHPFRPSLYTAIGDSYFIIGNEETARRCWTRPHKHFKDYTFDIDARIQELKQEASQEQPAP